MSGLGSITFDEFFSKEISIALTTSPVIVSKAPAPSLARQRTFIVLKAYLS